VFAHRAAALSGRGYLLLVRSAVVPVPQLPGHSLAGLPHWEQHQVPGVSATGLTSPGIR
jgi:hypothetical protein